MKKRKTKPAKAWAILTPSGEISKICSNKESAKYYGGFAKVIRVLITEIKPKSRKKR